MTTTPGPAAPDSDAVAEVFRAESGRALATIARLTGDVGRAEDAVQEAFIVALQRWPTTGLPDAPGAWITTTARNKALDTLRREARRPDLEDAAQRALEETPPILHPLGNDQLQLMFTTCHPALAAEVRVSLTLRLVCGLTVAEIARALLQSDDAVARRLHRAKAKIRDAGIPLRVPPPELLPERVPAVLECVYLTFAEGYSATAGDALVRHELCDEGVRLARLLVDLLPDDPGAEALLALVLLQDSRRHARLDPDDGTIVLLADQDRARWDHERIDEGLRWLDRSSRHPHRSAGAAAYLLQAAIAAEHARADSWVGTDWGAIVGHYDQLAGLTGSPVVLVNRAVAISFADGPDVARPLLDELAADPRLASSHLLASARADVRRRLGLRSEAAALYRVALDLAATEPERAFLRRRIDEVTS